MAIHTYPDVKLEDQILYIQFKNDQNKPNTVTIELVEQLINVLNKHRHSCNVVFFHGTATNGFLAGDDVSSFETITEKERAKKFYNVWVQLIECLNTYPVPSVCFIEKFNVGGGMALSCACDLIFADKNSKFGLPQVKLNLSPVFIIPGLIKRVGFTIAMEMAYMGNFFTAEEAKKYGVINNFFEKDGFRTTQEQVKKMAGLSGPVLRDIKKRTSTLINYPFEQLDPKGPERNCEVFFDEKAQQKIKEFLKTI